MRKLFVIAFTLLTLTACAEYRPSEAECFTSFAEVTHRQPTHRMLLARRSLCPRRPNLLFHRGNSIDKYVFEFLRL